MGLAPPSLLCSLTLHRQFASVFIRSGAPPSRGGAGLAREAPCLAHGSWLETEPAKWGNDSQLLCRIFGKFCAEFSATDRDPKGSGNLIAIVSPMDWAKRPALGTVSAR